MYHFQPLILFNISFILHFLSILVVLKVDHQLKSLISISFINKKKYNQIIIPGIPSIDEIDV